MAIEVSWPDDLEKFPCYSAKDANGRTMLRTGLVTGTGDHLVALMATGVPQWGDEYGSGTGLFCDSVQAIRIGGWDRVGNQTGGACKVTCKYSSLGLVGWAYPITGPESTYTEIDYTQRSVQVMWGWNPGGPFTGVPTSGPINNGEGAAKEVASFSLKVHAFTRTPQNINMARLLDLGAKGSRNQNPITMPNLKKPPGISLTPPQLAFSQGQLRYMGPESSGWRLSTVGNNQYIYEIVHLFHAAPDWLTQWTATNKDGVPISSNAAQIYDLADFGGLW